MENKLPSVFFSLNSESVEVTSEKYIVLMPTGKHNDFGLNSEFDYLYFRNGEKVLSGEFKIGLFDKSQNPHEFIREKLKKHKTFQFDNSSESFFSLQQEIQHYRTIVRNLGVEEAEVFLLAINDIVVNKKKKIPPSWLQKAISSKAFKNSLSRTSQAYFAYVNGGSVLDGVEFEIVGRISQGIALKEKINPQGFVVNPELRFNFNFESLLPARIVALIGENGVGKSQSLRNLVDSLVKGNDDVKDIDGYRPRLNRLLAIATAGEVQNTFPRIRIKRPYINYKLISHRRSKAGDNENGLSGLIVQLLRSNESIKDVARIKLFKEAIKSVLPLSQIGLLTSIPEEDQHEIRNPFLMRLSEFERINESGFLDITNRVLISKDPVFVDGESTYPLSSGQISFLRLAAQICLHIENGSLVLLDEPETHFHPKLISDLMSFLTKILEISGSIAILATHSAYVIREIPRKQVLVLNRSSDGEVEVSTPIMKTLGAEIGEISFSIFGEHDFGHIAERIKDKLKNSQERTPEFIQSIKEELPSEALMYLENMLDIRFGR